MGAYVVQVGLKSSFLNSAIKWLLFWPEFLKFSNDFCFSEKFLSENSFYLLSLSKFLKNVEAIWLF